MWAPQLAALRDRFRVIAPDLRGYEDSPVTAGTVTMKQLAADVRHVLQREQVDAAALVGNDAGDQSAAAAAALRGRAERPDYRPLLRAPDIGSFVCVGGRDT